MAATRYCLYQSLFCQLVHSYYSSKFGQTPLLLAVRKNNVAMVKELIGAGVDVNKMEQVFYEL